MKIGVSLPYGYLSGSSATEDYRLFRDAFGAPRDCLVTLRAHGVGSIEVGHVNAEADPVAARSAVDLVLEAGFGVTLHGYIPKPADGENFAALYPTIAPLADLLKARGAGGIMTLHSYRSAETAREVSSERTVSYLRRLSAILAREGIPLRAGSRGNQGCRAGTIRAAAMRALVEVHAVAAPACAGFTAGISATPSGTSLMARWNFKTFLGFVAGVIHTHLHDLAADGQTHWPFSEGRVLRWQHTWDALRGVGYQGVFNLEMYPSRWAAVKDA